MVTIQTLLKEMFSGSLEIILNGLSLNVTFFKGQPKTQNYMFRSLKQDFFISHIQTVSPLLTHSIFYIYMLYRPPIRANIFEPFQVRSVRRSDRWHKLVSGLPTVHHTVTYYGSTADHNRSSLWAFKDRQICLVCAFVQMWSFWDTNTTFRPLATLLIITVP